MYIWYNAKRAKKDLNLTFEEFKSKLVKDKKYIRVYQDWAISDFHNSLTPSLIFDRHNFRIVPKYMKDIKANTFINKFKYLFDRRNNLMIMLKKEGFDGAQIGIIFNLDRSTVAKLIKRSTSKK